MSDDEEYVYEDEDEEYVYSDADDVTTMDSGNVFHIPDGGKMPGLYVCRIDI